MLSKFVGCTLVTLLVSLLLTESRDCVLSGTRRTFCKKNCCGFDKSLRCASSCDGFNCYRDYHCDGGCCNKYGRCQRCQNSGDKLILILICAGCLIFIAIFTAIYVVCRNRKRRSNSRVRAVVRDFSASTNFGIENTNNQAAAEAIHPALADQEPPPYKPYPDPRPPPPSYESVVNNSANGNS